MECKELKWNFDYEFNGKSQWKAQYIVYKIENTISQKYYIGQTRRELRKRWKDYKNDLLKPLQKQKRAGSNIKLKRSVQKHYREQGNIDFLKFSIVEVVDVSQLSSDEEKIKLLDEREVFWIKEYRVLYGKGKVFNATDGGVSGKNREVSDKTKKKLSINTKLCWASRTEEEKQAIGDRISESNMGKVLTEEHKQKISEKVAGENNPMYGKTHTEESKRKNSESNKIKQVGEMNGMYGKRHTDDAKRRVSEANKGRASYWRGKLRLDIAGIKNPSAKVYDLSLNPLVSPTGEQFVKIVCLEDFCKRYGLSSSKMNLVLNKKRNHHKEWRLLVS